MIKKFLYKYDNSVSLVLLLALLPIQIKPTLSFRFPLFLAYLFVLNFQFFTLGSKRLLRLCANAAFLKLPFYITLPTFRIVRSIMF